MNREIDKKIEFGFADLKRIKLHYARAGNGKELVVLLHGFPEFWYSWRYQLIDLSDSYTVVAPDMRGYNLSDKPKAVQDYRLGELVEDVAALVKYFGFEKAAIVGHDWGASVAWAVSQQKPELLTKLACLQVPPPVVWRKNQTSKQLRASWYMFFFQLPSIPEWFLKKNNFAAFAGGLKNTTAKEGVFTDADIERYKDAWGQDGAITGALNYYRANILKRMFGKKPEWRMVEVPTLFIYGGRDRAILPQTVEGVKNCVSGLYTELRITESAHWVQNEARQKVTAALRDLLSK